MYTYLDIYLYCNNLAEMTIKELHDSIAFGLKRKAEYYSYVVVVVVVVIVVVFTLNRSFYRTTSAIPPVSFLILHPREIQILWSDSVTEKNQTLKDQGRQIKC